MGRSLAGRRTDQVALGATTSPRAHRLGLTDSSALGSEVRAETNRLLARILIGVAVVGVLAGCVPKRQIMTAPDVTFLTGDGCPNSTKMRQSLDAALTRSDGRRPTL